MEEPSERYIIIKLDGDDSDPEIDYEGFSHYEALGILDVAHVKMRGWIMGEIVDEDEDIDEP